MSKPKPIFRAVLVKAIPFTDTDTVKVICRITHAGLNGEDIPELGDQCALAESHLVTFRLTGADAMDRLAAAYQDRLQGHEEASCSPGTVLFLTARGIADWNGLSTFGGERLHRLVSVEQESLSLLPRTRLLSLAFAHTGRVEQAAAAISPAGQCEAASTYV